MERSKMIFCSALLFLLTACTKPAGLSVVKEQELWHEGKKLELFNLTNSRGMTVKLTNYAATITYLSAPDRYGRSAPLLLGFDSLHHYLGRHPKFGATIGRYANRIRGAEFELDGTRYPLEANNGTHSLHGGSRGFHTQVFRVDTAYAGRDTATVRFSYLSHHREGGFPGNLAVTLTYHLTNDNELILDYTATTDRPTVVNLTNHAYFNLGGCGETVLEHSYHLMADSVAEVDEAGLPTGRLLPVAGTRYNFTTPCTLFGRLTPQQPGYDHAYLLRPKQALRPAAVVCEPRSGRVLRAYTTEPAMQFYVSQSDMSRYSGHGGRPYGRYHSFCLEMQHFPDSPHHPNFPATVLRPGEVYRQTTLYHFDVEQ